MNKEQIMTVGELIKRLQAMPQNAVVEINDNRNGEMYGVEQVDHFAANEYDPESVVIQVNC